MALAKQQPTRSPLFSLPLELRLQIYRYLLVLPHEYAPAWERSYRRDSSETLHPAILRTCHAVYIEAVAVLYGENTFIAHHALLTALPRLRPWLPPVLCRLPIAADNNKPSLPAFARTAAASTATTTTTTASTTTTTAATAIAQPFRTPPRIYQLMRRWRVHLRLNSSSSSSSGGYYTRAYDCRPATLADPDDVAAAFSGASELTVEVCRATPATSLANLIVPPPTGGGPGGNVADGDGGRRHGGVTAASVTPLRGFERVRGVRVAHVRGLPAGFESYGEWLSRAMMAPLGAEVPAYEYDGSEVAARAVAV